MRSRSVELTPTGGVVHSTWGRGYTTVRDVEWAPAGGVVHGTLPLLPEPPTKVAGTTCGPILQR